MSSESMETTPQVSESSGNLAPQSSDLKGAIFAEPIQAESTETCFSNAVPINESPKLSPHTVYKIQYKSIETRDVIFIKEDTKPITFQSESESESGSPVLEFITDVYISTDSVKKHEKDAGSSVHVLSANRPYLKINSPAIINALQSVVKYYPGYDFSQSSICINEPFAILVHHEKELADFRDQYSPNRIQKEDEHCERTKNTYEHLSVLQEFLRGRIGASVEREKLRHERGFASFEMLWLLLKPGITVYNAGLDGSYEAKVVESLSGGIQNGRPYPLQVDFWGLDYDGETIGRAEDVSTLQPFNGEKEIKTLLVFPCKFWNASKSENVKDLQKDLEERGKMFFKLTSRRCMSYNGLSASFPRHHFEGFVIVDSDTYYLTVSTDSKRVVDDASDGVPGGVSQCLCSVCIKHKSNPSKEKSSLFNGYHGIEPELTNELTAHQYLICSSSVYAYVLETRTWECLNVACFSDPQFDTGMIDKLVMPDERRQMIKALAANYARKEDSCQISHNRPWTADFVEAKGEGKIFLLHGKPGVGKTYTAECIAHYTNRPLLSLTVSDIGTDSKQAEINLTMHFTRAKLWDAIILIDEADIYMENREKTDLARNSLVSGFLRAMERCRSILFLTTNRIGSFDDAFISRIHITIYYPDFTDEQREKVWKIFFDKLIKDRGDIMRVPIDTKDYINGQEVRALNWNGREIRNAVQTAVALADFEGATDEEGKILLKDTHIQQIVRMSTGFKDYLDALHVGDESKRAERAKTRYDEFDSQQGDSKKLRREIDPAHSERKPLMRQSRR